MDLSGRPFGEIDDRLGKVRMAHGPVARSCKEALEMGFGREWHSMGRDWDDGREELVRLGGEGGGKAVGCWDGMSCY